MRRPPRPAPFSLGIAALLALVLASAPGAWAADTVVYSAIPGTLPGNVLSHGFEATTAQEIGDHVVLAAGGRRLLAVRVVLSSWACQTGHWYNLTCTTTPGATFAHPVTLTLYAVDRSGPVPAPGAVLAARTQVLDIPFRSSADPASCGNSSGWYSAADGACHLGYAVPFTVDFAASGVTLPDEVIWTVSFNTTHAGLAPLGEATACFAAGTCPYDVLGLGVETFAGSPYVGADADALGIFSSYTDAGGYCDATPPAGVLRLDNAAPASPDSFACFDSDTAWRDGRPLGEIVTEGTAAARADAFACYDVRTHRPHFAPRAVTLSGGFGTLSAIVDAPRLFCTPADVDGAGIADAARRLTCYGLRERATVNGEVEIEDQVGEQTLSRRHRSLLCVPSAEGGAEPAAALDHSLVDAVTGSARPERIVQLADQYGSGPVRVQRTVWVGFPADKNGEGIPDPDTHLTCDKVPAGPLASATPEARDQFGALSLTLGRADALCLPARLVAPE